MKLSCDLCGGDLAMDVSGQTAHCVNCDMCHTKERLMEKLKENTDIKISSVTLKEEKKPLMRNLFLKRKFNLSGCAAKVEVILDGERCAILGSRGEACVPVCEGEHEIFVRIVGLVITELPRRRFCVNDKDIYGLFYLRQTAFSGTWMFELRDHF